MKLRRKFAFLAAIAIAAVGAAQAPLTTAGAADAGKPRSGGTLKMTVAYSTASLDPAKFAYYTCCATGAYANPVYDDLLRLDPTTAKISPGLALSLTSTDGINWTLKLRKGLKFSDNTPLDAEAVKFNWDRANSNVIYQARPTSIQITGMQVVDPETLKITLAAQNGFFDKEVASTLGVIASPTAIKEQGDKYGNPGTIPVGAGPYVMTSWVPDSRVVYKRNPNYWDAPRPYIENLELQINLDAESNYTSVTTGQNDWAVSASPDMTDRAKSAGLKTFEVPNFGVISYELNLGHPPFNDPRAREAINAAIDPNLFNALYYNSKGTISTNVLSEDSPYYDKSLAAPKYDAKKAQKLFSEIAKETGKPVDLPGQRLRGQQPAGRRDPGDAPVEVPRRERDDADRPVELVDHAGEVGRLGDDRLLARLGQHGVRAAAQPDRAEHRPELRRRLQRSRSGQVHPRRQGRAHPGRAQEELRGLREEPPEEQLLARDRSDRASRHLYLRRERTEERHVVDGRTGLRQDLDVQ